MIREQVRKVSSGYLMLVVLLVAQLATAYWIYRAVLAESIPGIVSAVLAAIVVLILWAGLFMIHPNEAKVLQLFGVDDYEEFVQIQSESALRNLSTTFPYEPHEGEGLALRSNPVEIALALREEIQDRLETAGVTVIEARISHLAYAPEIANAMLRRQQASAIIAARKQIVQGAVGMVDLALTQLDEDNIVELDEERKAAMVSNLLVVLCSDEAAQPVLNTSSLYT